jgi:hypothetical protein
MTEDVTRTPSAGRLWIRVGGVFFAVGAVAVVIAFVPLVSEAVTPHAALWFIAVGCIGIGTALALWGIVVGARDRSRFLADDGDPVIRQVATDEGPHD